MSLSFKKNYFGFTLAIIDLALFYLNLLIILKIRFQQNLSIEVLHLHLFAFTPLIFLCLILYFINNFYEASLKSKGEKFIIYFGRIQLFIIFFGLLYFYLIPFGITPKTNLFLFWGISSISIFLMHSYINNKVSLEKTNILFLNKDDFTSNLKEKIKQNNHLSLRVFFYPENSDFQYLIDFIRQNSIKVIIFHKNFELIKNIFSFLPKNIEVKSLEDFYEETFKKISLEIFDCDNFLQKLTSSQKTLNNFSARLMDLFLALFFLILSLPFWPIVMIIIKLTSPGPIFYFSSRFGKNSQKITLYKFRTMTKNARQHGPAWTLPKDNRITFVGKFLRRFYIDEWPQFFNILKGDLSFVGPRPEEYDLAITFEKEIPFYHLRKLVTPGLTGWAQLNMPNTHSLKDAKEKLKFDLFYLKNYSFWLNIYIIIKTCKIPFV